MKILYFSGTGNSYYIAKKISDSIEGSKLQDIATLFKEADFHHDVDDELVFVYPVYAFLLPLMVEGFFKHLKIKRGAKVYLVSNCAGKNMPVNSHVKKIIERKKGNVNASYEVQMPSNYIPFGGAEPDSKIKNLFDNADKKIEKIINAIKSNESGHFENGNFFYRLFSKPLWKFFVIGIKTKGGKGFSQNGRCNSCGICQKLCPSNNIELFEGKPICGDNCEQCMGCLQFCPQEAIELGKSKGKRRYHNPRVKAAELFRNK